MRRTSEGVDGFDKDDAIAPFGSLFFLNLARATWLVKKAPGASDNVVTVGLFPKKQNDGARCRPAAVELTFQPHQITVRAVNVADVDGLAERLPLKAHIQALVSRRPMTWKELEQALDESSTASARLSGATNTYFASSRWTARIRSR